MYFQVGGNVFSSEPARGSEGEQRQFAQPLKPPLKGGPPLLLRQTSMDAAEVILTRRYFAESMSSR